MATVRQPSLTGGILTVIVPPTSAAVGFGCVVLVEKDVPPGSNLGSYYEVHAYVGTGAGPTAVSLPPMPPGKDILVVDLPHGMFTTTSEITIAIDGTFGGNPPSGVGPT